MALPPIDELMAMNDEQLDQLLTKEVEDLINSVEDPEHKKRLGALQWKLDIKKANAPNKMAAMLEVYKMMTESFVDFKDALNGVERGKTEGTVHVLKA